MALFRMLLTALAWQLASAALLAQEPVKPTAFVNTPDFKASDTLRVQLWVLGIVCTTGLDPDSEVRSRPPPVRHRDQAMFAVILNEIRLSLNLGLGATSARSSLAKMLARKESE
ncbi:Wdr64 [Symbiodinium sp. CCMP2592]|nr:Wdr64 [Symbiodinium sp. CCMP2592]